MFQTRRAGRRKATRLSFAPARLCARPFFAEQLEVHDTRVEIASNLLYVAVGLLSILIAALHIGGGASSALSGLAYTLLGPVHWLHGRVVGRQRKRLEEGRGDTEAR